MKISFLEGQYELAAKAIAGDEEFRETILPGFSSARGSAGDITVDRELFDKYREYRLGKTVERVYKHSRFYKKLFDEAGLAPADVRTFGDLRKVPFTYPEDLRGKSYDFLCMSERHVERPVSFYSSGTTGIKKRLFFSFDDIERIKAFIGAAMNSIADTEDTRILSLMTNSQGRGASQVFVDSVRARGMEAWAGSMEDGAEDILKVSTGHDCNVWFGDIGTIYRTAKELDQKMDLRSLGLKLLYVTMGNVSDHARRYLEEAFGCELITHYGFTEAGWGFAIEQPGLGGYYSNELDIYTEVVDPATGETVPDGEEGELTFTLIGREAMPLIRYRLGDIAAITRAKNVEELDVIGFITRRLEGTLTTPSGKLITPAIIEDVIYGYPEVIDYRLYGIRASGKMKVAAAGVTNEIEAAGIRLEIETAGNRIGIESKLEEALNAIPGMSELLPVRVEVLPGGSLKQFCYEKKHFIPADDAHVR